MSAEMHDELVMFERYQIKSTNQNKKLLKKRIFKTHIRIYEWRRTYSYIYI